MEVLYYFTYNSKSKDTQHKKVICYTNNRTNRCLQSTATRYIHMNESIKARTQDRYVNQPRILWHRQDMFIYIPHLCLWDFLCHTLKYRHTKSQWFFSALYAQTTVNWETTSKTIEVDQVANEPEIWFLKSISTVKFSTPKCEANNRNHFIRYQKKLYPYFTLLRCIFSYSYLIKILKLLIKY